MCGGVGGRLTHKRSASYPIDRDHLICCNWGDGFHTICDVVVQSRQFNTLSVFIKIVCNQKRQVKLILYALIHQVRAENFLDLLQSVKNRVAV